MLRGSYIIDTIVSMVTCYAGFVSALFWDGDVSTPQWSE